MVPEERPSASEASAPAEAEAAPPPVAESSSPSVEDWETRFKYLFADFENFRRRAERERDGFRREAEAELLRRMIPLYEGFEQARAAAETLPHPEALRRGLELIAREWQLFFEGVGFAAVARVGEPFRADEHEAVGEIPAAADRPDRAVAEVIQQGYRFRGGLLRPAKVIVARAGSEGGSPAASEQSSA